MPQSSILEPLLRKLSKRSPLLDADRDAVLDLPYTIRHLARSEHVIREGEVSPAIGVLLKGYAYRQKLISDGTRQILSVHVPGDIVDLQNPFLQPASHSVQVFTDAELAMIPIDALRSLAFERSAVGRALWQETLAEASIQREWTVNVGRRNARERMGHLLCEIGYRVEFAGLGHRSHFRLPMTQEELADALGLTPVHVNRTLRSLDREGLTRRQRGSITINDWAALCALSDFRPDYMYLHTAAVVGSGGDGAAALGFQYQDSPSIGSAIAG